VTATAKATKATSSRLKPRVIALPRVGGLHHRYSRMTGPGRWRRRWMPVCLGVPVPHRPVERDYREAEKLDEAKAAASYESVVLSALRADDADPRRSR